MGRLNRAVEKMWPELRCDICNLVEGGCHLQRFSTGELVMKMDMDENRPAIANRTPGSQPGARRVGIIILISIQGLLWSLIIMIAVPTSMCFGFLAWRVNNRAKQLDVASGRYVGRIISVEVSAGECFNGWVQLQPETIRRLNAAIAQPRRLTKKGYEDPACDLRLIFADGYTVDLPAYFGHASLHLYANSPEGVFTAPEHVRCIYAGRIPLQPLSPRQAQIVQKAQNETGPP